MDIIKLVGGILSTSLGAFIIYQSYYYHLIDIIMIIGAILTSIGLCLLIVVIVETISKRSKTKKSLAPKSSKQFSKGNSNRISNLKSKNNKKQDINNSKISKIPNSKVKSTPRRLKFTPNYERPVKINRKPKKVSEILDDDLIDLSNVPDVSKIPKVNKSKEIFRALAIEDINQSELNVYSFPESNDILNDELNSDEIDELLEKHNINNKNQIKSNSKEFPISSVSESYVFCPNGLMNSQEAFEELAKNAKKEIFLETSSIKNMTNKFISMISKLDVKIILQDFDIKNMSYVLLVSSLIEQGVNIRTMHSINTTNIIADNNRALIISDTEIKNKTEIGAIYTDEKEVLEIRNTFEKSWELANEIDLNDLM